MIYSFGPFELDLARVELRAGGRLLRLEPQVFALLALLVENRERLVSRNEIFEKLWDGRIVSDSALSSRVKSLRKALGDNGKTQRYVKTVHSQGFRFTGDVRVGRVNAAVSPPAAAPEGLGPNPAPQPTVGSLLRPSIAVLPFRFIGDPGPLAAIGDGLPHELIAELARLRWLLVIARGSSFRLRGNELDMCDVGELLRVRYCLAGTVEVAGQHLAVTTELVDTRDGEAVWAERYTGRVDDVHAVRAEIRTKVLSSLEIQIPLHEAVGARLKDPDNLDAWSAYHLGLQHMYRFNRKDNVLATSYFSRAVTQDPDFARAHAGLSFIHFQNAFMKQTDDVAGEIELARDCAQRGLDLDPLDPFVNLTMGRSFWLVADLESSLAWLERTVALSPHYAQGIYAHALMETMAGNSRAGREHVDLAMHLSPLDPLYYAMLGTRGFTHMAEGEYAAAAHWTERAARSPGAHVLMCMIAAVAQLLAGNETAAREWADDVRARDPLLARADFFGAFPMQPEAWRLKVVAALRKLGF